jgi:hypothetical protein
MKLEGIARLSSKCSSVLNVKVVAQYLLIYMRRGGTVVDEL